MHVLVESYKPPQRKAYIVGQALTEMTKTYGLVPLDDPNAKHHVKAGWFNRKLHAECRLTTASKEDEQWHQDSDQGAGGIVECGLVLWCELMPTQFKYFDSDEIIQPLPYQVVLWNNAAGLHRRPPNTPHERMSFRQRVVLPDWY